MLTVTQTINNVDGRTSSPRASGVGISGAIYSSVTVRLPVKKEPLEAWILRAFTGSEIDDDLFLHARGFIFLLLGGHMLSDFSRNLAVVHDSFEGCTTDRGSLSLSTDLSVVDPLAPLGAIWCTSFDYSQLPMYTLITYRDHLYGYLILIVGITRAYISNPANRDTRSVGYQPAGVDRRMMTFILQEWIRDITDASPSRFRICPISISTSYIFLVFRFRAPPPLGTASSSTPHQPISQASSSNEEERTDDTDVIQHLGF
ncbi:hypothetical protein M9H77_36356 [Catharanthus roseus]|uniref:Uncharacterized protein n=1 Tax=Catharanthus roseus TaxID=4058 RepID=A0ACB9ZU65_CATRO|nr:hypothetical protein M9H77_36356 [Catharanthus roseus]